MPAAATSLIETWADICNDPVLQNLPFKIETDEYGKIVMSPTKNYHGFHASEINRRLTQLLPAGRTANELAILTSKGVKVADASWASPERYAAIFDETAASIAPEICVEVLSESNHPAEIEEKKQLYFEAKAVEMWIFDKKGSVRFFDITGPLSKSKVCPAFPASIK